MQFHFNHFIGVILNKVKRLLPMLIQNQKIIGIAKASDLTTMRKHGCCENPTAAQVKC
jgi:predicted transcriptional regulator